MAERPDVKICGLQRAEDAALAEELGAAYLGVILTDGFGRSLRPERAAVVLEGRSAKRVAVFVDEPVEQAVRKARAIEASVLQLHGSEPSEVVRALAAEGEWEIWKSVRARELTDVTTVVSEHAEGVQGLLVEGWREGVVGGGGARVVLEGSALKDVLPADRLFVLAGGLDSENVIEATARFGPDVVDVSSGVESDPGAKDPARLRDFFAAVCAARR